MEESERGRHTVVAFTLIRTVFCHAAFPQRFITSGLESCTMKYFGLLAIVLSLAAAEIYFQEKFDEGAFFVAYIRI